MAGIYHSVLPSQQATQSLTASQLESIQLLSLSTQELIPVIESSVADNPLLVRKEGTQMTDAPFQNSTPFDVPVGVCPNYERENPFFTWKHTDFEQDFSNSFDNIESPIDLSDVLHRQLTELHRDEKEKLMIAWLIGNLDDRGFLAEPLETLVLAAPISVPLSLWKKALETLQSFEPPGIAARNLKESLLLQIFRSSKTTEIKHCAQQILERIFENNKLPSQKELCKFSDHKSETTTSALQLIHSLCPNPTFGLKTRTEIPTPIPEVILKASNFNISVELNESALYQIDFDFNTYNLLKKSKLNQSQKNSWQQLASSAKTLLHALEYRYSTVVAVSQYIATKQKHFFLGHTSSLVPLTQKDIAQALGIHESTVSRAISGKYIQTPCGTFELKSLFCSSAGTTDISIDAVIERIRSYINKENPSHPLSDIELTIALKSEGISLARRTVAKYREMAGIASKQQRRSKN